MSKLKYAIIGSGTMGQEHIKNINLIDDAEVVAICDSHEKSIDLSKKLLKNKVNIFDSHIELIEAEIADAYIVATPNFTHVEILRDLLKIQDILKYRLLEMEKVMQSILVQEIAQFKEGIKS